jgi:hypothetical protein
MELVRRLWAATDPAAAYPIPFSETPDVAPTPKYAPRRALRSAPVPAPTRRGLPQWAWVGLATLAIASGSFALWQYGQSRKAAVGSVAGIAPPTASPEVRSAASVEAPQAAEVPVEPAPQFAPGPAPKFDPPLEKIDEEVARAITPVLVPVPESLKGKGDRITAVGAERVDVYVVESENLYYVRIPERGVVESVAKATASASISADTQSREALLALWNQNRDELARVSAAREKEKASRLASYRKAYEQQVGGACGGAMAGALRRLARAGRGPAQRASNAGLRPMGGDSTGGGECGGALLQDLAGLYDHWRQ